MNFLLRSTLVLCFTISILSQTLDQERATSFIDALINSSDSLEDFVLPEELSLSKRLGINYQGVKNKFLISYNIPLKVIEEIKRNKMYYQTNIEKIDEEFSILQFEVKQLDFNTKYYFKNAYLISPPYFFYKDWIKIESKSFIFYISNPEYFNQYSIDRLDQFVSNVFLILNYTEDEIQRLNREKIIYILCKDENEIEELTGYKARGIFNLAYDYIITTFNCHYHELVHLLMNYKLKSLPLFTHPFFQEGFAVSLGGRGGKESKVLLNLGCFLEESDFLNYKSLLSAAEFKSYDASMSYPISGLYNNYLLDQIGINYYLNSYLEYSADNINGMVISLDDLVPDNQWRKFISECGTYEQIKIGIEDEGFISLNENSSYLLKENQESYLIKTSGNLLISISEVESNYISKIYNEFYPKKKYKGEKYFIRVGDNEVAIYNLFTNNLLANYTTGFTLDGNMVSKEKGYYTFIVEKSLFDEYWYEWEINIFENE
ncbi:MAG: hypothetical protein JSW63_06890 [Ignavibacterium sp.]|nr:MAG: hypothetical protein JSW63_06890 [Ignavibacterium sp.]